MINVRAAQIHDLKQLIKIIKNMSNDERRYLRYNTDHVKFVKQLGDNILNGTVLLYLIEDNIIGYFEYSIREDKTIWIHSLYFIKKYRRYVFTHVTPLFVNMKNIFKTDIHFTVLPDNEAMKSIIRFIRAEKVSTYDDGRIEYVVKEVV